MRLRLHHCLASSAAAILLAGCASTGGLAPQGQLLPPQSLHAERSLAGAPLSPAAWPSEDWWHALGDPKLDALVAEALKDNPDLAAAAARARAADAEASSVDSKRKPALKLAASVSGARIPATVIPPPTGGHFGIIDYGYAGFSWDLDLWGGKRAAWEAAVGQAHAASVEAHAARLQLSVEVVRAYAQLGYAFTQQDLATAELERTHNARELTAQRVSAGIDSKLQLRQGDAEVATAEQQLAAVTRKVDAARVALSVLLGKGPDRGLDIQRPHMLTPAKLAVPANLPAQLLGHRPDLIAARWRVEAAARDIKSAKAAFLPDISLGALAGFAARGSENLFSLPARLYQVAPAFNLPIFAGGRLRANLSGKDAQYDLAVAHYNKTLIGALNTIADDFDGLRSLKQQSAAQQQALSAAHDAWDLAEQRYKAGVGSYLQALVVRLGLLQAEQGAAALHAQQVDLSIQLINALGGGFHASRDTTAALNPLDKS